MQLPFPADVDVHRVYQSRRVGVGPVLVLLGYSGRTCRAATLTEKLNSL